MTNIKFEELKLCTLIGKGEFACVWSAEYKEVKLFIEQSHVIVVPSLWPENYPVVCLEEPCDKNHLPQLLSLQ